MQQKQAATLSRKFINYKATANRKRAKIFSFPG